MGLDLVEAGEGGEEPGLLVWAQSRAVVADPEADGAVGFFRGAELNPGRLPAGGVSAVLQRVAQIVGPDLLDPRRMPERYVPGARQRDLSLLLVD